MKRTKTGHGPGKGNVALSCTIPEEIDRELRRLAAESGKTRSGYAKRAVIHAVTRQHRYLEQIFEGTIYPLEHPDKPIDRAAEPPPKENEDDRDAGAAEA